MSRISLPRRVTAVPGVNFVHISSVPDPWLCGADIARGCNITTYILSPCTSPSAVLNMHLDVLFQCTFSSQYGSSATSRTTSADPGDGLKLVQVTMIKVSGLSELFVKR